MIKAISAVLVYGLIFIPWIWITIEHGFAGFVGGILWFCMWMCVGNYLKDD